MKAKGLKRSRERWEETLEATLKDGQLALRNRRIMDGHRPKIVNMVSTVSLMPDGCKLPLGTLATHLGPCSQYAPQQFAANIIKLGDATGLCFSSGKLLLTAALTKMQVLYASHYFRLVVESVPYRTAPYSREMVRLEIATFEHLSIHNIVGNGHFCCTVDLERLRNAYPDFIEWVPDNFPAARCKIWVPPDQRCNCGFSDAAAAAAAATVVAGEEVNGIVGKHLKRKCRCIIKCLVFANGSIVMIGGKDTVDMNYVFFHMRDLVRTPAAHRALGAPLLLRRAKEPQQRPKELLNPELAITLALVGAREFKDKSRIKRVDCQANGITILMYLADAGRLEAVRTTLAMEPDQLHELDGKGKTVIERLRHTERNAQQDAVLDYLEGLKG